MSLSGHQSRLNRPEWLFAGFASQAHLVRVKSERDYTISSTASSRSLQRMHRSKSLSVQWLLTCACYRKMFSDPSWDDMNGNPSQQTVWLYRNSPLNQFLFLTCLMLVNNRNPSSCQCFVAGMNCSSGWIKFEAIKRLVV